MSWPFALLSAAVGEPIPAYPWIMLVGVWAALVLALRLVDDSDWERVGLGAGSWRARRVAVGWSIGVTAMLLTAALLFFAGFLRFEQVQMVADSPVLPAPRFSWTSLGATSLRLFVLLAPSALWEELVFRGYLWTVVEDAVGERGPLWFSSLAFGAVHITNPGVSVTSISMVVLAGICLGVLRQRTNSLPATWAAHLAWNWTMAAVIHTPVSGSALAAPEYKAVLEGPAWLTGGVWGPEGGIVAGLVFISALSISRASRMWRTTQPNKSRNTA